MIGDDNELCAVLLFDLWVFVLLLRSRYKELRVFTERQCNSMIYDGTRRRGDLGYSDAVVTDLDRLEAVSVIV